MERSSNCIIMSFSARITSLANKEYNDCWPIVAVLYEYTVSDFLLLSYLIVLYACLHPKPSKYSVPGLLPQGRSRVFIKTFLRILGRLCITKMIWQLQLILQQDLRIIIVCAYALTHSYRIIEISSCLSEEHNYIYIIIPYKVSILLAILQMATCTVLPWAVSWRWLKYH